MKIREKNIYGGNDMKLNEKNDQQWFRDYKKYNKQYVTRDKVGLFKYKPTKDNRILSYDVQLSLDGKQTRKNNNVFIVSDDAADAAQSYVIPNVLQGSTNYIVMDPGALVYDKTHAHLEKEGYNVRVIDLVGNSDIPNKVSLNPFDFTQNNTDKEAMFSSLTQSARILADCNDTLRKAEVSLLMAILLYCEEASLVEAVSKEVRERFCKLDDQNNKATLSMLHHVYENIMEFLSECLADGKPLSTFDMLMNAHYELKPNSVAYKYYTQFKTAVGPADIYPILLATHIHLQMFKMKHIYEATCITSFDPKSMLEGKQALFVIMPLNDTSYDAVAAILMHQIVYAVHDAAGGYPEYHSPEKLSVFLNIDRAMGIPNLELKVITGRKRWVDFSLICGYLNLLQENNPTSWEVLIDACDTILYLDSREPTMMQHFGKYIPEALDTAGVLAYKPDRICIVLIRGLNPMCCAKYKAEDHPNYPKN